MLLEQLHACQQYWFRAATADPVKLRFAARFVGFSWGTTGVLVF
jgi:hypothetical protein